MVGGLHTLDLATAECASCPSCPGFDRWRGWRSFQAANDAVVRLVQVGVLMERTGYQQNRSFVAPDVLQILNRPFGTSPL